MVKSTNFFVVLMLTIYSIFIISDVFHSIRITPNLQGTPKIKSSRILYIPIIANAIPEVDESSCRWSYTGSPLLIYYKWGNNLQTPGSLWRTAFESGISAWNSSLAHIVYWYSNNTPNFIDTYSASDGNRGTTVQICTAGGVALRWEIRGNIYYESDGYTINMRRGHCYSRNWTRSICRSYSKCLSNSIFDV